MTAHPKDTGSKSIDDAGNWTLCLTFQQEDEYGGECDSIEDALQH